MNFGFRRTLPLVFGVALGLPIMIGVLGFGLGQVFEAYPIIYQVLKYGGAAYMLYLAWKIATSKPSVGELATDAKPLQFWQMALFQWVNPKAWIMAITSLSAYTLATQYYFGMAVIATTFLIMGLASASTWAMFGVGLRQVMNDPRYFRIINVGLALLLVLSLVPMFMA